MSYRLSVDAFDSTFAVREGGTKLTHFSGKRFKLFPFIANNNSALLYDLDTIIGRYISKIEGKTPVAISVDTLTEKLRQETSVEVGMEELFQQVIKNMFFDKDGKIRSINLRMIAHIPCEESSACKVADYLVDVLGDKGVLRASIDRASAIIESQSNVLEKCAVWNLESTPASQSATLPYQRITNAVQQKFESDFDFILGARNRTRDYLIPLLEFYYFTYTAQAIMQLNRFMSGEREHCVPLYFCLDWEKTSLSRLCYTQGWGALQAALSRIFAHAIVLEIINQTEDDLEPVDYIRLNELAQISEDEDHRIAGEIRVLTDRYRNAITDCPELKELVRKDTTSGETAAEIRFLFDCVRTQFENTSRQRPYSSYANKFEEYSRKFLKRRGRSGMMLNLSEETLIFLTKVCIKDQEKMRLNDVFAEFEARGIFLDNISKEQVMHYYEKLNLIEKKSDSGDAQYVKRIL